MVSRNKIKISVIVPVYNVKQYLRGCIDSILAQSFTDMEIICVDDGSTDGSSEILDEYALADDRIRVIHKENSGYGHSMNVGIEAASGEYIGIVESDDAVRPEFYETLYRYVKEYDLDIVKSEFFLWWEKAGYSYRIHRPSMDKYFGKVIGRNRQFLRCSFLMNTWSGLYRRDFLNEYGIRHHESPGASYQDNGFWMQGMLFAERVMVIDYAGYMYRQDNESASVKDPRKAYAIPDEYEWLHHLLKDRISNAEMVLVDGFRLTRSYWSIYRLADDIKREFCSRLIDDYRSYGNVFIRDLWWQDTFSRICDQPDDFCKGIIETKKKVTECLEREGSIIIYGAGQRGERIYRILLDNGWSDKVSCFIETNTPSRDKVGNIPVYKADDEEVRYENAAVIISTSRGSRWYDEMKSNLDKMGVNAVLDSDDLVDNFYNFT